MLALPSVTQKLMESGSFFAEISDGSMASFAENRIPRPGDSSGEDPAAEKSISQEACDSGSVSVLNSFDINAPPAIDTVLPAVLEELVVVAMLVLLFFRTSGGGRCTCCCTLFFLAVSGGVGGACCRCRGLLSLPEFVLADEDRLVLLIAPRFPPVAPPVTAEFSTAFNAGFAGRRWRDTGEILSWPGDDECRRRRVGGGDCRFIG